MDTLKKNYNSENFILLGRPYEQKETIELIVSIYKNNHPDFFEGERNSFIFELRYTEPFEKQFAELKRLQGLAAKYAGRRNEFQGYIIINLSSYLNHCDEHYFKLILYFLMDMNETWKYIFLIDNKNEKSARELVSKLLELFIIDNIPCKVIEERKEKNMIKIVHSICKAKGMRCTDSVIFFFVDLLCHHFSEEAVSQLITIISWNSNECVNMKLIDKLVSNPNSMIRYMLNKRELDELNQVIESNKEKEKYEETRS